jgi:F-type H+-transporting ATPase subunit a
MPEHTSWFTYLMSLPLFRSIEAYIQGHQPFQYPRTVTDAQGTPHVVPVTMEYVALAVFSILVIILFSLVTRARIARSETALVPEGRLTVASFMENLVGVFYGTLKDALGEKDAKYFLPLVGTCGVFIFFSNALGLVPGFAPPTSNLNVTLACGLIIFVCTHVYGVRRHGLSYFKHFFGPIWWIAPLIFVVEVISHLVRPITLGFRLMVNMFVDHLLLTVITSLVALFIPIPIMLLGILVVTVQTYVFCLLSTVYIQLAIEHHEDDHHTATATAHAADPHHGHGHAGAQEAAPAAH